MDFESCRDFFITGRVLKHFLLSDEDDYTAIPSELSTGDALDSLRHAYFIEGSPSAAAFDFQPNDR
jgi:hypothetical protein